MVHALIRPSHRIGVTALAIAVVTLSSACGSPPPPSPVTRPGPLTATCAAAIHAQSPRSPSVTLTSTNGQIADVPDGKKGAPWGTYGGGYHTDTVSISSSGIVSVRSNASTHDLPVVGGGRCGVTTVQDGKGFLTVAPTGSDTVDATVLDAGETIGDVRMSTRLPSGQVVAVAMGEGARTRQPAAYWVTSSGQYFSSTGGRGHAATAGSVRVVLFPSARLVSYSEASGVASVEGLEKISPPPMFFGLGGPGDHRSDIALLPAGSHDITKQFNADGSQGAANSGIQAAAIPGTRYMIAVLASASNEAGDAGMQWTDAHGHVNQWRSNDLATP
ncbi:MAG: hypothetical protein M3Y49_12400 [Actinomycetota bacterium]|nr:hypothetical protein [Actinomycetota bacterium]